MIGVVVYSIKNAIKQFCQKKSKRLDVLMAATPCLNKNDKIVTRCYTKVIDSLLGAQRAEDKKKIPHMCWYFRISNFAEISFKFSFWPIWPFDLANTQVYSPVWKMVWLLPPSATTNMLKLSMTLSRALWVMPSIWSAGNLPRVLTSAIN